MEDCSANQVESALEGIWEILALHPWDLIYLSIPMSILAFYGLSIYAIFKHIQKKYSS
jgi:hypothetical protein|tara:strand:- start:223 stop:396 length:174 start_codon:yes stop_codon:yes gene_type:complete